MAMDTVRIEPSAVAETGVSVGLAESGPVAGLPGCRGLPILGRNPLTGILPESHDRHAAGE